MIDWLSKDEDALTGSEAAASCRVVLSWNSHNHLKDQMENINKSLLIFEKVHLLFN